MSINSDDSGFLIGESRLKELNKGVDKLHADTTAILAILLGQIQQEAISRDRNYKQVTGIASAVKTISNLKPSVSVTINTGKAKVTRSTTSNISVDSVNSGSTKSTNQGKAAKTTSTSRERDGAGRFTSKTSQVGQDSSSRDSRGRFTGTASGINERTFLDNIKRGIDSSKIGMQPDVSHLDPTVDAVRELTTLFEPGKRAFSLMGRGAMWLFKRRKSARAEDIPRVQNEHNDEVERHNHEERKLLRKLIDAVNRGNNKGLAGLIGPALLSRLMGGGGGRNGRNGRNAPNTPNKDKDQKNKPGTPVPAGGGKDKPKTPDTKTPKKPGRIGKLLGGLGKRVPYLGALLGAGMLASDWSERDASEKGGGIGALVGGGIGGVLGAFGGPVGAVAGATAGSYLGEAIGQRVGKWTGSLEKQNIGSTMIKGWNTTLDVITNYFKLSMLGMGRFGGMGVGFMRASFGGGGGYGGGYSSGSSGGTPSNYNPDNEIPITRVLESGKGYNVVELADGSVIRQEGNWNWRNRNAGNISDGDFARSRGRVDQSGAKGSQKRFAVFPTFAAGRKAKKELLFEGQNYRDLDLMAAIARYAPKHENNTAAYQKRVLSAVGSNKRMSDYTAAEREVIMNAIQAQEGSIKSGKVTVIKPPTKSYNAAQPATTNSGTAKPLTVSTATANQARPLYASSSPAVKPLAIPAEPRIKQRVNSPKEQPVLMASANDVISQNPADRDIAHAITGGLGMRTQMV